MNIPFESSCVVTPRQFPRSLSGSPASRCYWARTRALSRASFLRSHRAI